MVKREDNLRPEGKSNFVQFITDNKELKKSDFESFLSDFAQAMSIYNIRLKRKKINIISKLDSALLESIQKSDKVKEGSEGSSPANKESETDLEMSKSASNVTSSTEEKKDESSVKSSESQLERNTKVSKNEKSKNTKKKISRTLPKKKKEKATKSSKKLTKKGLFGRSK